MKKPSSSKLTVLILSYDRHSKLLRLLNYLDCLNGEKYTYYILDSSVKDLDTRPLQSLFERNNIQYCKYDSHLSLLDKIREGLEKVTTPYAVFWADDDFMVPRTFEAAIGFLDQNPDYGLVQGKCGMFNVEESGKNFSSDSFSFYPQRENFGESASARLLKHLDPYTVTFYSIHRTEILKKSVQLCKDFRWDYHFEELVPSCLSILHGKVKSINRLYMLRERHADAGAWTKSQNMRDVFDWVVSDSFAQNWEKMQECLSNEIARIDGISLSEAKEVVKKAFWRRLAVLMDVKRAKGYSEPKLKRKLRTNKKVHSLWMYLRSLSFREQDQFLLPALKRKTSPYHQDFKAIYQWIIQK